MNTFEQSIIEAAQAATPNNTDAEREAARVAATQAVAEIMSTRKGLDRTLALPSCWTPTRNTMIRKTNRSLGTMRKNDWPVYLPAALKKTGLAADNSVGWIDDCPPFI